LNKLHNFLILVWLFGALAASFPACPWAAKFAASIDAAGFLSTGDSSTAQITLSRAGINLNSHQSYLQVLMFKKAGPG
jgi:hypothetical protein